VTDATLREAIATLAPAPETPVVPWYAGEPEAGPIGHEAVETASDRAVEVLKAGGPLLPYSLHDATGGLADPKRGGLKFGVEIEFVGGDINALLRDMWKHGLTRTQTRMLGDHASKEKGYSEDHHNWVLEFDGTVDGELVSPILPEDTRRVWQALQAAKRSVTANGGTVVSAHVHVSVDTFGNDVRKHAIALALFRGYQNDLFRVATNPRKLEHRGYFYCKPLPYWGDAREHAEDRYMALNFESAYGADPHVEFRLFDGGDEAEMQIRIDLALAMVAAADRLAGDPNWQFPAYQKVGKYAEVVQQVRYRTADGPEAIKVYEAGTPEQTAGIRKLLETIFPYQRQQKFRDLVLALWVITPWPRRPRPDEVSGYGSGSDSEEDGDSD
jgi:hypothetical protein